MTDNPGAIKALEVKAAKDDLEGPQAITDACATMLEQPAQLPSTRTQFMLVRPLGHLQHILPIRMSCRLHTPSSAPELTSPLQGYRASSVCQDEARALSTVCLYIQVLCGAPGAGKSTFSGNLIHHSLNWTRVNQVRNCTQMRLGPQIFVELTRINSMQIYMRNTPRPWEGRCTEAEGMSYMLV